MKLRKRKSTEKQVEILINTTDGIENTAPSFLTRDETALTKNLRGSKRIKREEVKTAVLDVTIKVEDIKESNILRGEQDEKTGKVKISRLNYTGRSNMGKSKRDSGVCSTCIFICLEICI